MDKQAKIVLVGALLLVTILFISIASAKMYRVSVSRVPNSCSDTDGGFIPRVKGMVSGYLNNVQYNYTDFCQSSMYLREYACNGKRAYSGSFDCVNSTLGTNSCFNGACVSVVACNDGVDNDGDTYTDYPADPGCSSALDNSELGTAQCDNGVDDGDADTVKDYPSDLGCLSPTDTSEVNGQCDDTYDNDHDAYFDYPADPECTSYASFEENCQDSDGGFRVYVKGAVTGSFGGSPYNYTDYCMSGNQTGYLTEYYCSSGAHYSFDNNCGSGNTTGNCVNGACVNQTG